MPKPNETCTVIINGREFRDWESVQAVATCTEASRYVTLTVTEKMGSNGAVGQALQIKAGDECEVKLAGQTFLKGKVFARQVSYDANNHAVRVTASSATQVATQQSIPLKDGNFRGYSFQAIANKVLQPLGISLKTKNPPSGWEKPFKNVQTEPGESVWNFLDRLAKYRGVWLTDDEHGNMVAHGKADQGSKAGLVEGQNILSASATMLFPKDTNLTVVGSQKGDDNTTPDQNRGSAAKVDMKGGKGQSRTFVADIPVDADDAKRAAESTQLLALSTQTEIQILTQGWLTSGGKLPAIRDYVDIDSPAIPFKGKLQIAELVFSQDQNGTRTAWTMRKYLSENTSVEGGSGGSEAEQATTPDVKPGTAEVVLGDSRGHVT